MFLKAVRSQMGFQLKQRGALCVFYILLGLVLHNFIGNVLAFEGRDAVDMYQPMKLLLLSYNRTMYNGDNFLLLVQLYPLLAVIPAGFALAKEYQTGQEVYLISRLGSRAYKFSKLTAAFSSTFIIFTVPFLLEILLNCLSFPLNASGDLSNWGYYDSSYINSVHHYIFSSLYQYSPYLYAVVMTLLFGVVSGCLGAFTVAFSSVVRVRYNVFLFLPVFLLLHAGMIFGASRTADLPSISWYDYISLFNGNFKNSYYLPMGIILLTACSIGMVYAGSRRDCI